MTTLNVQSHALAKTDIFYLLNGHHYGETRKDITVVLDRDDTLDFLKTVNTSLYETVSIETEGEYFYITSSITGSFLYIEDVQRDGEIVVNESDIMIFPHYVPQEIRKACVAEIVVDIALESIYEKLVKIIEA